MVTQLPITSEIIRYIAEIDISFCVVFGLILDCGKIIHSDGSGGLIKSPHYPQKYKSKTFCEWKVIASKQENKILIQLESFKMEGKMPLKNGGKVLTFATHDADYSYVVICCFRSVRMTKYSADEDES